MRTSGFSSLKIFKSRRCFVYTLIRKTEYQRTRISGLLMNFANQTLYIAHTFLGNDVADSNRNASFSQPATSESIEVTISIGCLPVLLGVIDVAPFRPPMHSTPCPWDPFTSRITIIPGKRDETKRCARISVRSFDETSMDSCPLAVTDGRPNEPLKDAVETEVTSLEEAKSVIATLRARQRAQAHQMLAWRRTLKLQVNQF